MHFVLESVDGLVLIFSSSLFCFFISIPVFIKGALAQIVCILVKAMNMFDV